MWGVGREGIECSYKFANLVQVSMCMYWKVMRSAAAALQQTLLQKLQEPEKVLLSVHTKKKIICAGRRQCLQIKFLL